MSAFLAFSCRDAFLKKTKRLTFFFKYAKIWLSKKHIGLWRILMEDYRQIIAKNILELRLANNMTQLELGEKLNYSDKTISKWERAESSPDIGILVEIATLFGVTLDYLVEEEHDTPPSPMEIKHVPKVNRKAIEYISEMGVWVIATFAFIITTLIIGAMTFQFLYFVYAFPVVLVVKLVFNSIWFNRRHNYYIVSLLMWALLASIHITFFYFNINVALIYLLGVVGQIVIVCSSFIPKPKSKQ